MFMSRYIKIVCITMLLFNVTTKHCIAQKTTPPSLLKDTIFNNAHVGIYVLNATTNTVIDSYQSNKYFIPSSNTKIATCYAAMQLLGDSLLGLQYQKVGDSVVWIFPTGDPTFLHPSFKNQPVLKFLSKEKIVLMNEENVAAQWRTQALGKGWAWDDYSEEYMAERSMFPIYGNTINVAMLGDKLNFDVVNQIHNLKVLPPYFSSSLIKNNTDNQNFKINRNLYANNFFIVDDKRKFTHQDVPFKTSIGLAMKLLKDTMCNILFMNDSIAEEKRVAELLNSRIDAGYTLHSKDIECKKYFYESFSNCYGIKFCPTPNKYTHKIYSQPTDSLLQPMMFNSDNFFAEQTLQMLSFKQLGYFSDEQIIDTLLKSIYKNLPQKPRWVDGSGLSRYNLFTPQSFVSIINTMLQQYGWLRVANIFPTGNQGTLKNYYKNYVGKIYAKTGSMSNNYALSGFLKTKKQNTVVFSILINNYVGTSATAVKLAIEKYLIQIIEKN